MVVTVVVSRLYLMQGLDIHSTVWQVDNRNFNVVSTSLDALSKSILVRRAYYDTRKIYGHKNSVVFMVDLKRSLWSEVFVGCRVGPAASSRVHFRQSRAYKRFAIDKKHVTKNVAIVYCFDIDSVTEGDAAFLRLSHHKVGSKVLNMTEVRSQRNVIVPQPSKDFSTFRPSVVSCVATLYLGGIPPYEDGVLYQWLCYQKTIGVDHVHMIAEDTFAASGGFKQPIIQNALKENFLSIDIWPRWFNTTEIYHSSQHLASNDCVYKFQGVYHNL